jgi:hypothetical protein
VDKYSTSSASCHWGEERNLVAVRKRPLAGDVLATDNGQGGSKRRRQSWVAGR